MNLTIIESAQVVVTNSMMTSGGDEDDGESGRATEEVIKCHRVILAARCPYFRRALLSGMREAIERCFIPNRTI